MNHRNQYKHIRKSRISPGIYWYNWHQHGWNIKLVPWSSPCWYLQLLAAGTSWLGRRLYRWRVIIEKWEMWVGGGRKCTEIILTPHIHKKPKTYEKYLTGTVFENISNKWRVILTPLLRLVLRSTHPNTDKQSSGALVVVSPRSSF